jgi:putative transposase
MSWDRTDTRHHHPRIRLPAETYANPDAVVHVTVCTLGGQPVFRRPELATAVVDSVDWLRDVRKAKVFAYCVMPDHLHLLVSIRAGDHLSPAINTFKSIATKRARHAGHAGLLWQDRFHDRVLRQRDSGIEVVEYILNNPVRKGIVKAAADYPYSGTPDILDASYLHDRGPAVEVRVRRRPAPGRRVIERVLSRPCRSDYKATAGP